MAIDIFYYVSGHGWGHATRSALVVEELLRQIPGARVHIRSRARIDLFSELDPQRIVLHSVDVDPQIQESPDALDIDVVLTVDRIVQFDREFEQHVQREVQAAQSVNCSLIVSDISPIAGNVARELDVPCVGIGNFTWDWICEPYLATIDHGREIIDRIRSGYECFDQYLRLPLSEESHLEVFQSTSSMPMIANSFHGDLDEVRAKLGIRPGDKRPIVLVVTRGCMPSTLLQAVAEQNADLLFIDKTGSGCSGRENVLSVASATHQEVAALFAISDIVVAKLGYGILSDALANDTAILFPDRANFRETPILESCANQYGNARRISKQRFYDGQWRGELLKLLGEHRPRTPMQIDGAKACAEAISRHLA